MPEREARVVKTPDQTPRIDAVPHKETEQRFPHSWTLAVETDGGVVGLISDEYRLHLVFPKHTDEVLDSIPSNVITRFGTELAMSQAHPRARKHLDFEQARSHLRNYSDPDLRKVLGDNGIPFENHPYVQVDDELVMATLGVERGRPVKHVGAIAVDRWDYKGELKDENKPLVFNNAGQVVAYQDLGERQHAKFYGPMEKSGGRVWVDLTGTSGLMHLPYIDGAGRLSRASNDYNGANMIETFPYSFYNIYAPEGPTAQPEKISKFRDGFINLTAEIAMRTGNVRAVNVTPHEWSRYTPKDLAGLGFENVQMLDEKYDWGRAGWKKTPDDVVIAQRGERRAAMIDTGRDWRLWTTTISRQAPDLSSPTHLADLMRQELKAA